MSDATQRSRHLNYYLHDSSDALRFELAGWLSKDTASDLEQAWRTASSMIGERRVVFDLSRLAGIDESGQEVLSEWSCRGALLGATSHHARGRLQALRTGLSRFLRGRRLTRAGAMTTPELIRALSRERAASTKMRACLCNPMKVSAHAASVLLKKPSIS